MNTRNQIKILKEELKYRSALRKEQKVKSKRNQSNYDKLVSNRILKGIMEGTITQRRQETRPFFYRALPEYKEAIEEYNKVKEEIPKPTIYRDDLTAGYILYNRLRNRPSHLGDKEKENAYHRDVNRWIRWLEKKEKVLEDEESGVGKEVGNAS